MFSAISVAPCEIVSLKLKFDSFVKIRVAQGILVTGPEPSMRVAHSRFCRKIRLYKEPHLAQVERWLKLCSRLHSPMSAGNVWS